MAQHAYSIINQSGAAFRADLNNGLAAIVSNNSGATEPATMYAYQWWANTTTGSLLIRNSANSAWVTVGTLASANLGLVPLNGAGGTPTSLTLTNAIGLPVAGGGTGVATLAANGILFGNGTGAVGVTAVGTATHVLTSNGTGVAPTFQALSGVYYNRRPPLHRGPLFTLPTTTTLSVIAGAVLNGYYYSSATAVTMPTHTNNADFAIWQHPTTGALVGDASFVTAPAGATGGSIVAGYHYIPSGRPTAFNNGSPTASAQILEYSIWDLTWRPECPDPRGMTCIDGRFWCDIYLCGKTSYATTTFSAVPSSKIGLTIADNSDPALIPSFYGGNGSTAYTLTGGNNPGSWYNFAEVAHSFGKRFMWSWEFQAAAFGAPEAGSRGTDPGTVQWERASKWGLAQATGTLGVLGAERVGIYTSGPSTNTGSRGAEFADAPRVVILGGTWGSTTNSGSRYAVWAYGPSDAADNLGARFACNHLT